ncbi:MAG: carboxypeptidase-like regulatory domain-containing protein [Bacteroidota bacterium]
MRKLFANGMLFFMLASAIPSIAQSKTITISGRVTSFEESLPLEGVSVRVKGSNNSTGTQADGTFSLAISDGEKVLLLSLAGYERKEIPITNTRDYEIVLKRSGNSGFNGNNQQLTVMAK